MLSEEELRRYARTIAVDRIGREGQEKLKQSGVLVVGCGALGTVAATYLCAAGVGRLAIADSDTVDVSNLQRQIMFAETDAGMPKCATLASRLRSLNPLINVVEIPRLVMTEDAETLFPQFDFIIDGSDNPDTKFMTSSMCRRLGKPCCIGGVSGMRGQVMTFIPGSAAYHEVFSSSDVSSSMLPCATGGVLGPVPGIVASVQASEAIKYLTGSGQLLTDRLLVFDLATARFTVFPVA